MRSSEVALDHEVHTVEANTFLFLPRVESRAHMLAYFPATGPKLYNLTDHETNKQTD